MTKICGHCDRFETTNANWHGGVDLHNPTIAEIVAWHRSGECVTADPPGVDYASPANRGR